MKTLVLNADLLEDQRQRRPAVARDIEVLEDLSPNRLAEAIVNVIEVRLPSRKDRRFDEVQNAADLTVYKFAYSECSAPFSVHAI